ncbi:MAG TPA: radical SAM protein [Acidobacteriota bacterium]
MKRADVLRAWGRILQGYPPSLSIEITTLCPLKCPGCYAYQPEHVGGAPLESLSDLQGSELVQGILDLVDRYRPLSVHLVGGEPLVRHKELSAVLPQLDARGVRAEVVTSAVRPIPLEWTALGRVNVVVSIDGLQPEHDVRRKPATYERILKHIRGHRIIVHCTITSSMMERDGYLEAFVRRWSEQDEVGSIRLSFFTPQVGETSREILTPAMRAQAVAEMRRLRSAYPKLQLTAAMLEAYLAPPGSPDHCIFARITRCISADLESVVSPCQFGGNPDCGQCGCVATMALHSIGEHRLFGGPRLATLFETSHRIGDGVRKLRERRTGSRWIGSKIAAALRS